MGPLAVLTGPCGPSPGAAWLAKSSCKSSPLGNTVCWDPLQHNMYCASACTMAVKTNQMAGIHKTVIDETVVDQTGLNIELVHVIEMCANILQAIEIASRGFCPTTL